MELPVQGSDFCGVIDLDDSDEEDGAVNRAAGLPSGRAVKNEPPAAVAIVLDSVSPGMRRSTRRT